MLSCDWLLQTPGMLSHPPIPVTGLNSHIEELKAEGAAKFTAEYESIEPGQQFTWDNSSMDINKPKNRSVNSWQAFLTAEKRGFRKIEESELYPPILDLSYTQVYAI